MSEKQFYVYATTDAGDVWIGTGQQLAGSHVYVDFFALPVSGKVKLVLAEHTSARNLDQVSGR